MPFVKIMPGPVTKHDACYSYSKQLTKGIRFVSYHHEPEPEAIDTFLDTAAALEEFRSSKTTEIPKLPPSGTR